MVHFKEGYNKLMEKKRQIYIIQDEYRLKIKNLDKEINGIQIEICNLCEETGGHEWVREREPGPYGESFTICKRCNCDFYT
jgi:hypothetical protein